MLYLIVLYEADNRVKLLHNLGRLIKKDEEFTSLFLKLYDETIMRKNYM
jgi:hypothetical protein